MRLHRDLGEVIDGLDALAEELVAEGSPLSYFPLVYRVVSQRIKVDVVGRAFRDGDRMDAIATSFARRYFEAVVAWRRRQATSRSWRAAFARTVTRWATPLEHLLLSMHAHIHLDLPAVLASELEPGRVATLQSDYERVGEIFTCIAAQAQTKVGRFSPALALLDFAGGTWDERLFDRLLRRSRASAWREALSLADRPAGPQRERALLHLDGRAAKWALGYVAATAPLRFTERLRRGPSVREVAAALREMT